MDQPNKNGNLEEEIINIFKANKGRYGYRKIKYALLNDYGLVVNHKLILRIMKKYDLIYHPRRKRKDKWFIDNVIMSSYYSYNLGQKIRAQYRVQIPLSFSNNLKN